MRERDGVVAVFADDGQRILVGADGVEIARGCVTEGEDDPTANAPAWIRGVLSVIDNRVLFKNRRTYYDVPRLWPAGVNITDDTGLFSLVGESASRRSSDVMTRLLPAPLEGQPGRAVFA